MAFKRIDPPSPKANRTFPSARLDRTRTRKISSTDSFGRGRPPPRISSSILFQPNSKTRQITTRFSKSFESLRYDAVAVGNHDLEINPVFEKYYREKSTTTWLSANIVRVGLPVFQPYKILETRPSENRDSRSNHAGYPPVGRSLPAKRNKDRFDDRIGLKNGWRSFGQKKRPTTSSACSIPE